MTQEMEVLKYLKNHKGITSMEAFKNLGITRLSARIYNLKDMGGQVSKKRESYINREGEKSSYDRYFVDNLDEMIDANMSHIPRID